MKKYQKSAWVLITSLILLTGFDNTGEQNTPAENLSGTNNIPGIFTDDPVKVSIADATAVRSDKGQRPVKVMIYLSKPATQEVTVKYNTEDGSAKAGADYVATNGSVTFQPGEVAKWITVQIIGEVAADPDVDAAVNAVPNFIVKINQAIGKISQTIGVIIDMAKAIISILPYIPANISGNQAVYEVIISYTGYSSFSGTPAECRIRPDGIVVLSGFLSGKENVASDDDILYTGILEMIIDIDICSMRKKDISDEDELCGISVNGSGKVFTELKIYFADRTDRSGSRGGYIQIENKDGQFIRTVSGSCDVPQKDEEWTMVPNKTIASVFNGKELPMLTTRTLRKGTYTDTDDQGNITVVEVIRKIQ